MAVRAIEEAEPEPARVLRFTPPEDIRPQDEPSEEPPKPVRPIKQVKFPAAEMLAVLTLMLKILSTRLILALAGIGAFILALMALNNNSIHALIAAGVYDLTVFAPCIYLTLRRE